MHSRDFYTVLQTPAGNVASITRLLFAILSEAMYSLPYNLHSLKHPGRRVTQISSPLLQCEKKWIRHRNIARGKNSAREYEPGSLVNPARKVARAAELDKV